MAALTLKEISQMTSTVSRYRENEVSSIFKKLCQLSCYSISSRVITLSHYFIMIVTLFGKLASL